MRPLDGTVREVLAAFIVFVVVVSPISLTALAWFSSAHPLTDRSGFVAAVSRASSQHSPSVRILTKVAGLRSPPEGDAASGVGVVVASIRVGSEPWAVAYDSGDGDVYVPNAGSGNASVIHGLQVVASAPAGEEPFSAGYDSANGYVYFGDGGSSSGYPWDVNAIDTSTLLITEQIAIGLPVDGVTFDPSNGYVYVANNASGGQGTVTAIDGGTVEATIPVGAGTWAVAYDAGNGNVYAANLNSNNVSIISGLTVKATIPLGSGTCPDGVGYDSGNGYIYVSNECTEEVVVINGTSILGDIPVGYDPAGIAYDSETGDIYVANLASGTVSVIDGTVVVGTISVGTEPNGVAYDGEDGDVYVSNIGSDNVSVIAPTVTTYSVSFDESGLPLGTEWWVNLTNGQTFHSTKSTLSFKESNGTDQFSIATADKHYRAAGGTFTVAGASVSEKVKFTLVTYKVTFTETGLPSGSEWWVNLTNGQSFHSTKKSLSFSEANGTYSFATATTNKSYKAPSGKFAVEGAKVTKKVKFTLDPETHATVGSRILAIARWRPGSSFR